MRWLLVLLMCATAWAHKPSDAHVQLVVDGARVTGSLAVAVRDLDGALDLDANGDGNITWAEVRAAATRIDAYERAHLTIDGCTLVLGPGSLVDFSDGAYWTVAIDGSCDAMRTLRVHYELLFAIDAQHRGIIQVVSPAMTETVVARSAQPIALDLRVRSLGGFALVGVLSAPLSLLVLFLLLLPVAGRRVQTLGAFLAGALATALVASAGWLHLPPELVELCLVLSALLAAAANVIAPGDRFTLAFELGLVHGFGIALWASAHEATSLAELLAFAVGVLGALGIAGLILARLRLPYVAALSAIGAVLALVIALQG